MKDDLYVQEGITEKQIEELLQNVKRDSLLHNNTNDLKRFASRTHFGKWIKIIENCYVLTNKQGRLLGLVWFTKKQLPKLKNVKNSKHFNITFGIRLYEIARGKKLSYPFMKEVFKKALIRKVWLVVLTKNLIAINLYRKFGFEIIYRDDKITYMTYENTKK